MVRKQERDPMETTQILTSWTPDAFTVSAGLLLVRLVLGLTLAAHGAQKLFGWFGGYGIAGTGGWLGSIGDRAGRNFAALLGLAGFVAGLFVARGLLGPVGPALIVAVMIVAMITVHWKNAFFVSTNGVEHPLMFA